MKIKASFLGFCCAALALSLQAAEINPVKVIFDTDIGNDVDDAMAIAELHALESRGVCKVLGMTITKPDELAAPFIDVLNTFYGRPNIPMGYTHSSLTNVPSSFLQLAEVKDGGQYRYAHKVHRSSDLPEATALLRELLSREEDHSVVLIQVGYFSNLAALLDTKPDTNSPLSGRELIQKKVKFLSVMAGAFKKIGQNEHFCEFNVVQDLPASRKVAAEWPTPIVWSGFEIGAAIEYPAESVNRDFAYVAHHPVAEAYCHYIPMPHNRPTWDLTAVLYAVYPERGYFGLSEAGQVSIDADGSTHFVASVNGRDRYLTLNEAQVVRVKEAFVQWVSEPAHKGE